MTDKFEQVRIEKLQKIEALGVDPWGGFFPDREPIASLRARAPEEGAEERIPVRTAGRIMLARDKGKVHFIDIQDKTGKIQLFVGKKQVGEENWELVKLLDLWDLVGVEGNLGRTRTGEISIFAEKIHFLTKTLAHPPEKHKGAQDVELRLRRRYLDMIQNPEVLGRFEKRSVIVQGIRNYLGGQGYLEVETPTMHSIAGGAAARPFITHHNALDLDLFMRIALELPLKRCLVGGIEKVYEIGRVWRNEGIDASHNPEFTMLELYEAFGDYNTMMALTEGLIVDAVERLGQGMVLEYGESRIDFTPPFKRASYAELFEEKLGFPITDAEAIKAEAKKRDVENVDNKHVDVLVNDLFEEAVEDGLTGPIFVLDYPASLCPLTKRKKSDPHPNPLPEGEGTRGSLPGGEGIRRSRREGEGTREFAERFELYIAGMEIANAYTELNDPLLQEQLFSQQLQGQKEEDSMAKMDHDFILALKHGMPPAGGLGVGIDRLVMLLTNSQTIRDVIIFPLLRPRGGGDAESGARDETTDGAHGDDADPVDEHDGG